jgi:DUF2919 family protein
MIKKLNSPAAKHYAKYSVSDFDSFDCLKLSKGIYLSLLFVLRGYIAWIMSVTNMRDKVAIIQWLYPEPELFYLSLASGAIGLYLLLVISLRRPDAANWVKVSWLNYRSIMVAALVVDLVVSLFGLFYWQLSSLSVVASHVFLAVIIAYFTFTSSRIAINVKEFPEKVPD